MKDPPDREVLLFNQALQLPASERAGYLNASCGDDRGLRRRISALIESHERAGAFLQEPPEGASADSGGPWPKEVDGDGNERAGLAETCGDHVGRYKLLQQIGEGGCGVVYMAEQAEPVRRRVALKVIKLGMDTRQIIARFDAERQALAMMDHPNIAKVFDAGATAAGRPYFVMELVRGPKLTDFCDAERLSTEARLQLFIQVCHAIQHAHQKGVIHRDIKPTNILVPVNDGVPVPKVIDFGIAKATQGRLTDQTLFTAFEQFIGTPAYMSPEQAVLTSVEVDTRSDIYSLGVLLYELLTGQTPFVQKELLASGLDEMRRTIREKDPLRPSTRLSAMVAGDLATVARNRQSQPPQLIHLVRGDLDWIVMKCLQKDRARRYETVNALAMDLQRHLNHHPVLARPDSRAYRMRKFVRRHRASVAIAALVFLTLLAGLTGTITQARRATRHAALAEAQHQRADEAAHVAKEHRDFALRQLSRAEAINDLNTFVLSDAAPSGKTFTARELLARAEQVVARQTGEADDNRVELLISIGHQYENLDEHGKARELLGQAYELSRKLTEPSIRAEASAALSVSIALAGEHERGEVLIQEALRELGDAPQFVLHRVFVLLRGSRVARESGKEQLGVERAQAAERLLHESKQASPLSNLNIAMELAESYRMAGRVREAAAAFEEAFKQLAGLGRDETERAGTLLNNWALAVDTLGLPLEAERLYRRAMEISSVDGSDAAVSPMLLNNLARTLTDLHRFDEATTYGARALEKARRAGDEQVVNMTLNVLFNIYRQQEGKLDLAEEALREFETQAKKLLPPGHSVFAIIVSHKAMLASARGDHPTALAEMDRAVAMTETKSPERLYFFLRRRAKVRLKAGRYDEALTDATRALQMSQAAVGKVKWSSRLGLATLDVARALEAQGKLAEARATYSSALEHLEPALGSEHPETVAAAQGIADCAR